MSLIPKCLNRAYATSKIFETVQKCIVLCFVEVLMKKMTKNIVPGLNGIHDVK